METKLLNVKGTNDYLPEEQIIRNRLINTLKSTFELYGYLPLETPMLCYYELLASKYAGGSEILKEVYKFEDQGKRSLALRYDLTVPFSKVLGINKGLILPFKRYEVGKVFRDGPVKPGREREFYQCDVDSCGIEAPYAECEYFLMTKDVFNKLSIDVEIHYNNRKFLSGLLEHCNVLKENISKFILCVDKLDKLSKEEVKGYLLEFNDKETIDKVFEMFAYDLDKLNSLLKDTDIDILKEGLNELNILNDLIKKLKINNCIFTPFLARGLEIYTGTVWEIFDCKKRIPSALGGGGRYDNIITKFLDNGNVYPSVGMSFGLEPIYELLKGSGEATKKYDVYVYSFDRNSYMYEVSNMLRNKGLKVLTELNDIKLKKAMNTANRESIKYVILIGEDEIKQESVSLKNMETGSQELVKLDNLYDKIKR